MFKRLFYLSTIEDLAKFLGEKQEILVHLASNRRKYYRQDQKIKPDGRIRIFFKPYGNLKKIQTRIHRKWLKTLPAHEIIHSYRKKRDQVSNAKPHIGNPFMIKLDIEDFFPSVTGERVYKFFRMLNCSDKVATILTKLTTFRNQLPQGAPTSPVIANQILKPLVNRIDSLCSEYNFDVTVFADDITVSGTRRVIKFKNLLVRIIKDEGFKINLNKIKVLGPKDQKVVTGVVVNEKINVDSDYYRNLRAIVHNCRIKGPKTQFNGDLKKAKDQLMGKLNHVKKLNPAKGSKLIKEFKSIYWNQ